MRGGLVLPTPAIPDSPQADCCGAAGGRGYDGSDAPSEETGRPPGRSAAGWGGGSPPMGSKGLGYGKGPMSSDDLPLPVNAGLPPRWGVTELNDRGGMSGCAESRLLCSPKSFLLFCKLVQLGMRCPVTFGGIAVAMTGWGTTFGLPRPQQHRLIHLRRPMMMSSAIMPATIETGIEICRFCLYHA